MPIKTFTHQKTITLANGSTATHTASFIGSGDVSVEGRLTPAPGGATMHRNGTSLVVIARCCNGAPDAYEMRHSFPADMTNALLPDPAKPTGPLIMRPYTQADIDAEILAHVEATAVKHASDHIVKDYLASLDPDGQTPPSGSSTAATGGGLGGPGAKA